MYNYKVVKIFDKEYKIFFDSCCSNNRYRTLYVSLTNKCNASCSFCSNSVIKNKNLEFDLNKFNIVANELINQNIIDKISLTGGEPLILENFNEIINSLDNLDLNFYALTTNSTFLLDYIELLNKSKISYINISRHHYDYEMNQKIFKTKMPSDKILKQIITNSDKCFRFNLTLFDDYSDEFILKYLDWVKTIGIKNVLIRPNFIDLNKSLNFLNNSELIKNSILLKNSDKCKCIDCIINDIRVEFRFVNLKQELEIENKHEYIRNFIYHDNSLFGGWSENSLMIF